MFSFSNLNQDQQNTPFFQDHEQKPSIFNSQFSDQISAFDLFNSHQNNSNSMKSIDNIQNQKLGQQYFKKNKQNARNSKKSIILQLDQFDRKEAFKDLENAYNSGNSQIINFLKPTQYNRMAESRVKKIEFNQFEKQSQSNPQILEVQNTRKSKQKNFSFNMQLNFVKNNLLSNQKKLKQSNITQNNLKSINNPPELQKINISDRFGKIINKKSPSIQQNIAKTPQRQVSQTKQSFKHENIQRNSLKQNQPQKVYFNDQQFSFNLKMPKKQQSKSIPTFQQDISNVKKVQKDIQIKNNFQKEIQKQDYIKSRNSTNQSNNGRLLGKNGQATQRSTIFNPVSFQNLVKQSINLKNSRVLMDPKNIQTTITDQKTSQIDIKSSSANLKNSQSNKFSLNNFSNMLKKSLARDNQIEKNNNIQPQKKNANFNNKQILTNKQIKSISFNIQKKFYIQNKPNKPNILIKQPEKTNLLSIKIAKPNTDLNSTNSNKNQITNKNQHSNLNFSIIPQKLNKPKEKPCFNLKIIKQPSKNENKSQKQKKSQLSNVIIKQQINKRQDITTVKLLKNSSVFDKGLTFKNFDNKQKQINKQKFQEKHGLTPKIMKIESKSAKLFTNRQTQKLKQQKTIPLQIIDNLQEPKTQPINYQLYQNQLNKFEDEIQQTKRKYLNNQNNYRQIFLLLNKANMILNQKSLSQTQGTNTQTKIAKI